MGGYNFDKDLFRKRVRELVKLDSKVSIEDANPVQIYKAVGFAIKEQIIDPWIDTRKKAKEQDVKMVYYLSMEFLMGRALGNNILNIQAQNDIREVLEEFGVDLNLIEDQERDCGAGKRRSGTAGSLFPGFPGNAGLSCLWLRHPLQVWHVQAEDPRMVIRWRCRMNWLKDRLIRFEIRRDESAPGSKVRRLHPLRDG